MADEKCKDEYCKECGQPVPVVQECYTPDPLPPDPLDSDRDVHCHCCDKRAGDKHPYVRQGIPRDWFKVGLKAHGIGYSESVAFCGLQCLARWAAYRADSTERVAT